MSKIKIVAFAPNAQGGVYVYLKNLAQNLIDFDVNIKIALYGVENFFESNTDLIFNIQLDPLSKPEQNFIKLRDLIPDENTIILANDSMELEMCNYYKLKNKLIFIMHGDNPHYASLLKYPFINKILYVSDALSNKYCGTGGQILHPIVENGKMNVLNLEEVITISYVGRLEAEKGAAEITILDKLLQIEWAFFVSKTGSNFEFIKDIHSKQVFLDHPNSFVLSKLKSTNFLFFPSLNEGFGIAVLEAMKCGVIPIVKNNDSGIMAYLLDGFNCIKYENIMDIIPRMRLLMSDPMAYDLLKKNTYNFALQKFDKNKILDVFLSQLTQSENSVTKTYIPEKRNWVYFVPNWVYRMLKRIKYANN